MPYSDISSVESWGQFSSADLTISTRLNYESFVNELMETVGAEINAYCRVPTDFFQDGGISRINELNSGKYLPCGNKPLLRPNYTPLLKVHKLEYYESDAWTVKSASDYIVAEEGVYLIDLPDRTEYSNIRLSYQCGYDLMPPIIHRLSDRMTAAIVHLIIDAKKRTSVTVGGVSSDTASKYTHLAEVVFTKDLRDKLFEYRMAQTKVYRG